MQNSKIIEMITIDRRSKKPYDIQIKESIKALILDQTLYYQDKLPDPETLSKFLNIEHSIVEQAYRQLIKENHIKKTDQDYEINYLELTNYFFDRNVAIYDAIIALGLTPSIECVTKKVVEISKKEANLMGFTNDRKFLYINRIYKGNSRPLIILENYLPLSLFPDIEQKLHGHEPLNDFLLKTYQLYASESHRTTKAVNLPKNLAKYLNEQENAPSISSTNHVYDQHQRLIDYGRSHSISSYYFQSMMMI